jgi:prephenate dehydrogenase
LSLQSVKNELEKCEDMLKNDDWQGIHDWIEKANRLKGIL